MKPGRRRRLRAQKKGRARSPRLSALEARLMTQDRVRAAQAPGFLGPQSELAKAHLGLS